MKFKPEASGLEQEHQEARLLELYRRMRQGQKEMFRELAEVMVHREQGETLKPRRPKGED